MDILINVVGQQLKLVTNLKPIVSGSQNFIRFKFNFNDDWNGFTKVAQFQQNGEAVQDVIAQDDSVYLPSTIEPGECILVLYGTGDNGIRATTNYLNLSITKDMIIGDAASIQMTDSVFNMIVKAITGHEITQEEFDQIVQRDVDNVIERYREEGILSNIVIEDGTITREKVDPNFEATLVKADTAVQQTDVGTVSYNMLTPDVQETLDTVSHIEMAIPEGSISRSQVNAEFEATLAKADTAMQGIDDGSITRAKVDSNFEATLAKADTAMQSIGVGTIARPMVNADFENTLSKADTAMQPSVYNPNNIAINPYTYADQRTVIVSQLPQNPDVNANYLLNDNGKYMQYRYVGSDWVMVSGSSAEVVEELPQSGDENTDYYIPNDVGSYSHYRWLDDDYIEIGGSSSTLVVDELPNPGIENVDYILRNMGEYQYYKWIDNDWRLISGGTGDILTYDYTIDYYRSPMDDIYDAQHPEDYVGKHFLNIGSLLVYTPELNANEEYEWKTYLLFVNRKEGKDYYVQFGANQNLMHFRYIDETFVPVGLTKKDLDAAVNILNSSIGNTNTRIDGMDSRITQNQGNITSLNNTVTALQQAVSEIDTEGYEYYADYGTYEVGGQETDNVYRLRRVKGQEEEVVSQFIIQGGGGGQQTSTNLVVERITPSPLIVTPNDKVILEFRYSSVTNDQQQEEVDGSYTLKLGSTVIASDDCIQGLNSIDVTSYCNIGTQRFSLNVTDLGGSTAVRTFTVQKVDVRIESDYNDRYPIEMGKSAQFTYTPYGAVSKTIHFKLNGEEETITTSSSGILQSYVVPAKPHGTYLLDVWITATINGTDVETNHIYKDLIWYDPTMDDQGNFKSPVIGCNYRYDYHGLASVRQYDTLPIVYNVYDPTTNYPVVRRYVDDVLVGTDTMETAQTTWNFKSDTVGEHTLRIECRNTSVTIIVNVTELGIDVAPITGGLELDFNPVGITNGSENRIWENDNYHMSVSSNFDWANGGYKTDEDGNAYFLIKAGTTASFDYTMFDGGVDNNPSRTGSEMKIVFMTENVQDPDAVWFSNVETRSQTVDDTTVTVNMGIQMSAHSGWLKTNKASDVDVSDDNSESVAATNTYLYMPYSEEDIIEMDINIDSIDLDDETSTAFVMSYEDGVPSKAYIYDRSDRFYQYDPQPIVIGSNYCDIRIYRLKIYSTSLSSEGVMRNFIADSRDSTTMLARYDRNSIYYNTETGEYSPYNTNGIIDPERLAPMVPNVKVLMLETDHFTTSKKTFVKSNLRCIHAPGGDIYPGDEYYDNWYFENGWHSGQGTTSDNYGNSGRNVDFLFNCDGVHNPSDKIKDPEPDYISRVTLGYNTENAYTEVCDDWKGSHGKISLTRTSIPNNFFNLKVNIASSENANNALMQKRYTDYLPYFSPAKKRDSKIKNTMEFVPAILFIKETNPDVTTHNEFQDNEWHFYALGNLGDSKKTDYTRAYNPEDMNEFTIEISDNTKNNATFQTGVYDTGDGTLDYEHFHLVKTLDKEGELVVTAVSETSISEHIFPVPTEQADTLLFQQGTIHVINETGDPQYDGDETGYLNMRIWCLYNEGFDGDHSFEPRYACCGDYRDGKLVNDYSGYGKKQVKTNEKVWRAFYKWVITSTNEQFVQELDQWCVRSAVEFFYAFTLNYTMMDNRAKNTFWHFAQTGTYRPVSRPVEELLHIYCELIDDEYVPTEDTEIDSEKTYYTQYAFDQWGYDMDTGLGIKCWCQV